MSYAVETKKRKFQRVLDSLTKPSSAESSKPPTAREQLHGEPSAAKKIRLGDRDDGSLASARRSILKVGRPSSRDSSASSTRPSFVPWDRERFLERLETFRRVDRWSPKPSAISEVEWAKRGWICTDKSRVTCVGGCGGSVVVKLPDELDELDGYDFDKVEERRQVRDKLVEEYASRLAQGHGESCPWRNKGCDATIHRLALSNADNAISALQTRYSNLVKMADQLPAETIIQTPGSFNIEEVISTLPPNFDGTEAPVETTEPRTPQRTEETHESLPTPPVVNRTAFILAFFGWDTTADKAAGLASCSACFRRLGLWMYKPKENGDPGIYDSLEVATEHMEYCPWVNGKAQSGTGRPSDKQAELPSGWEVLAQALRVKHRRRMRSATSASSRAVSESPSVDGSLFDESNDDTKKASDREWWSKILRMRQMLNVKTPKKRTAASP
ncbi:C3HC zinc finger protein [Aspergillus taichungensis]|uniref:C3HC zinc finger protein n=1 Tax=Aspergillus taichungensis TaxID=482145 RepID=A0A2J5HXC3_9EURO|nr:C3HC zinc finger protein [Aspergillus taichungensis]